MLFEHGFYLKSLNWALICVHYVTLECVVAVTDHFAYVFVRKNIARVYMTLWRRNDVRKLSLTPFFFEKLEKGDLMFKRRFQRGLCWNQVKYARITITHFCFTALTLAGYLWRSFNTRPRVETASSGPGKCKGMKTTCVIPIIALFWILKTLQNICKLTF